MAARVTTEGVRPMDIKYYQTAWSDLKNSPGWFKKLMILALLNFIPIFGQIVTFGYLYGWARDIAWGVHNPLSERVLGNEDGKLYRRGFYALLIMIVFSLVPGAIDLLGSVISGGGIATSIGLLAGNSSTSAAVAPGAFALVTGTLFGALSLVAQFAVVLFGWVAIMRMSIYDDLGAGFQISTIWKMMRHDLNGLLRILGMSILLVCIVGFIFVIVATIVTVIFAFGAISVGAIGGSNAQIMSALAGIGLIAVPIVLAVLFFAIVASLYIEALVARAMGYWTYQFGVAQWQGKDDPLPFEYQAQTTQYPPQY